MPNICLLGQDFISRYCTILFSGAHHLYAPLILPQDRCVLQALATDLERNGLQTEIDNIHLGQSVAASVKQSDWVILNHVISADSQRGRLNKLVQLCRYIRDNNPRAQIILMGEWPLETTQALSNIIQFEVIFAQTIARQNRLNWVVGGPALIIAPFVAAITSLSNSATRVAELPTSQEAEIVAFYSRTLLAKQRSLFEHLKLYCHRKQLASSEKIWQQLQLLNHTIDDNVAVVPENALEHIGQITYPFLDSLVKSDVAMRQMALRHYLQKIVKKRPRRIGFYYLQEESVLQNLLLSDAVWLLGQLAKMGIEVMVYEPRLTQQELRSLSAAQATNLKQLLTQCDMVLARSDGIASGSCLLTFNM